MAWQAEVGSGSDRATTYHDFVSKVVAAATSQRVATVAINAAGSGYVTGDIVTLTHAGAYLDARFEVTATAGAITALRIVSSGAFANRIASATVSAGGTNYAVGDILEVQGGSSREKGKMQVATLSGSAVATVTVFESGGAYSSTPSNPASTTKVGPNAGTGSGCTLTVTYTGLIGTTGLSVTGGTGTGGTVNITLAEVGWSVDGRNTNSTSFNSVTNEKEVVLKGDAAGRTNKPYVGFTTFTRTSGVNTRYCVALHGMIAHNSAISYATQPGILGNPGTWSDTLPYVLCDENAVQSMDFWLSINDYRICGVLDTNSGAAGSDDRQLFHFYLGYYDSFGTEVEDPYPMFIGGAAQATNIDPSASTTSITGLAEALAPSGSATGLWFYRSEDSNWINVENSENTAAPSKQTIMFPLGRLIITTSADQVVDPGPVPFYSGIAALDRSSPTRRLYPIPGTTPLHLPIPLTIVARGNATNQPNTTLDTVRGNLAGCFFIYNTTSAGATITNFALDYILVGSDRYRVFHTHVQRQLYHYICIKEDV